MNTEHLKAAVHIRISKGKRQYVAECLDFLVASQHAIIEEAEANL